MSGPEFHLTGMGKRFFEGQLPNLIRALEGIQIGKKFIRLEMPHEEEDMIVNSEHILYYSAKEFKDKLYTEVTFTNGRVFLVKNTVEGLNEQLGVK